MARWGVFIRGASGDAVIAWKLWTTVPHVKLWEAVALVLNIEPTSLEPLQDGWMAGPGRGPYFERRSFPKPELRDEFEKALSFAERGANYSGPIHLRIGLASGMNKRTAEVSLSEVVAFFASCEWPDIPAPLLALVPAGEMPAESIKSEHAKGAAPTPKPAEAKRWTPERLDELRAYRKAHGTKEAALWAGISEARVRELLPGEKQPLMGFSAFAPGKR